MSQTIKMKRSAVPGRQPSVDDLELGELAVNTFDGVLYTKINDGFDSVKKLSPDPVVPYTAGPGITINNHVISSTVKSAGTVIEVQIGDGQGNFSSVPQQPAGRVLTSNGDQPPTWEPVPVSGGTVRSVDVSGGATGLSFAGGPVTEEGVLIMGGTLAINSGGTGATTVAGAQAALLPPQAGNANRALFTDGSGVLSWEVPPGQYYSAGTGLELVDNEFSSIVANNTGEANRVTISNGDGTLSNLPAGTAGYVLRSLGPGAAPAWMEPDAGGTVTSIDTASNVAGLTLSGGPITTSGTITLDGVLSVNNGGTGGVTAQEARTNILPSQAGRTNVYFLTTNGTDVSWATPLPAQASQSGKFLTTDGTTASWQVPPGTGTVTSVGVSGGTTGLTTTGGPVTTNGTITLSGTLAIANGGTGATTALVARTNLLPSQADKSGNVLVSNGTDVYWSNDVGTGTVTSVNVSGGATGLTTTGGPITAAGTLTLGGTLNIASGGTGATTASAAINALLPTQATNTGKILGTDGTNVSWVTSSAGTVTSVGVSGGTTGLTTTGGPVTGSGTITLAGTLAIANGGTGATTASAAINALVPSQTGQAGRYLMTNGTVVGWSSAGQGSVTSVDIDGGTTGLTATGGPITSAGTFTLGGRLALANGGTGATSAQQARNNILPEQATHAGQVLVTDGTNVSWSDTVGTGTVTSVNVSGGSTGMTFSGGPVTGSGTITLAGTLAIANGGTGATTASAAINALVPSQTGNAGRVLSTNGTSVSWVPSAAGSNTQVIYNNAGALAGSANFTFNSGTNTLSTTNLTTSGTVDLTGGVQSTARTVAASSIDCSTGTYFTKAAPTGALTWTFDNAPTTGKAYIFALALTNGGAFAQTWPTSVIWPSGAAPTLSTGTTVVDLLIFSTSDGGTTWRGSTLLNYAR